MQPHTQPGYGFTGALGKAGLGIGSTPAELKIAAPNGAGLDFAIDGIAYHAADDATVAMSAHSVQAADTTCLYLVQLDSVGALTTKKGDEVLNTDLVAGNKVLHWPKPDAGKCPIGAVKVKTVAVTFTAATTDLDASGVTDTYYDFGAGLPHEPLTS